MARVAASLEALAARIPGLKPGTRALVAVSGGRDSVALLDALVAAGWRKLVVVHLDHRLRGRQSDADASFVRKLAQKLGLPCVVARAEVARLAEQRGISIETAGREARRTFFARVARARRCRFIFTAHHADDQAETVLHRLGRGASLHGASAMREAAESLPGLLVIRPLLRATRAEIDQHVAARGLSFREDPSNQSPRHTRNRIRHELLPLMRDIFQREVGPILGRFAALAEQDDACLDALAMEALRHSKAEQRDGSLRRSRALQSQPDAIAGRILHRWLRSRGVPDLGQREVEAALAMLRGAGPLSVNLPGGTRLRRDAERLWVESLPAPARARARSPRRSSRRS